MTTFRISKNQNFTTVDNTHINDDRLSWKATAILTYLLSKPDNWVVHIKQLAKAKKCGIKAVYTGVQELKALGYIEHEFIQGADGKFINGQYIVHEIPIEVKEVKNKSKTRVPVSRKPHTQNGNAVNGDTENRPLLNTDRIPLVKTDFNEKRTTTNTAVVAVSLENPKQEQQDISKQLKLLIDLIPTKHQSSSIIIKFIEQKLIEGVNPEELKACILYVKDKAKGNTSQFKSYLGKCLDQKWASGLLEEFESERLRKQEKEAQEAMQAFLEAQKRKAEREEQERIKAENNATNEVLKTVDLADLDKFIESPEIWDTINSFEQKRWKRGERYLTRYRKVKLYLQNKLLETVNQIV